MCFHLYCTVLSWIVLATLPNLRSGAPEFTEIPVGLGAPLGSLGKPVLGRKSHLLASINSRVDMPLLLSP
ncbi:hypothetical protein M404DRAFT_537702 [Pisolithus tinctorius Marx 270]|uniref:Secreted protein n=1 Tax=Pisolithus tinctorius Marx 270 TaxID=870435 RepID=A0A0C3J6P8_PISTI|nr:hypothetical protein M404DRAFT_537702 [Pisolithus tinctorius Marx 270]